MTHVFDSFKNNKQNMNNNIVSHKTFLNFNQLKQNIPRKKENTIFQLEKTAKKFVYKMFLSFKKYNLNTEEKIDFVNCARGLVFQYLKKQLG